MNNEEFRDCEAILLDYGGTLDSDGQHWLPRFVTLYGDAGFDIPRPEIERAFYHAVDTCYADEQVACSGFRFLVDRHVRLQFEALRIDDPVREHLLAERFRSACEACFEDRLPFLGRMKRAYRLGVVSNFYGNLETVLGEARLSDLFEVIIDSNRVGVRKPDPRIFLMALTRLGLPASRVIFVGDSYERDMIPAMETGMKAVWLKGHEERPEADRRAGSVHAAITRLSDLEGLLR